MVSLPRAVRPGGLRRQGRDDSLPRALRPEPRAAHAMSLIWRR